MDLVSVAIAEAARAASLEELGTCAFAARARALDARPVFLGEVASDFVSSKAVAGEHQPEFRIYMRDYVLEDPIGRAALSAERRILLFDEMLEEKALRTSRAYTDFHRHYDFEHHMMMRIYGERLPVPGALVLGFTRGKRQGPFGRAEARIARRALPAFLGAAERIQRSSMPALPNVAAPSAERVREVALLHGLTRAETDVLAALALGLTNSDIARRLCISVETVKTHALPSVQKARCAVTDGGAGLRVSTVIDVFKEAL